MVHVNFVVKPLIFSEFFELYRKIAESTHRLSTILVLKR